MGQPWGYRGYGEQAKTLRDRVLARCVSEDRGYLTRCLIWQGEKDKDGYGRVKRKGKYIQVHWALAGDPPEGMEKDHLCHQRDCIRPTHLQDVTRKVNNERRRTVSVSKHLTSDGKAAMMQMFRDGMTVLEVVAATGYSRTTVQKVKAGTGPEPV